MSIVRALRAVAGDELFALHADHNLMLGFLRSQACVYQGFNLRAVASKRCLLRAEIDRPLSAVGKEIMPFRVMMPVAQMLDEGSLISPSYWNAARSRDEIVE